jgi:hypothetical protein
MFRQIITGAAAVLGLASTAQATVEISTTARGLVSNVRVVGQALTLIGPVAPISGRTSPGYSLNNSAASLDNPLWPRLLWRKNACNCSKNCDEPLAPS